VTAARRTEGYHQIDDQRKGKPKHRLQIAQRGRGQQDVQAEIEHGPDGSDQQNQRRRCEQHVKRRQPAGICIPRDDRADDDEGKPRRRIRNGAFANARA